MSPRLSGQSFLRAIAVSHSGEGGGHLRRPSTAATEPDHPEHERLLEWGLADFDLNKINVADVAIRLTDLAKRRQRKPYP